MACRQSRPPRHEDGGDDRRPRSRRHADVASPPRGVLCGAINFSRSALLTLHSTQVPEGLSCGDLAAMVVIVETNRTMVMGRPIYHNLARPPAQARSGSIMDELDWDELD